MEQKIAGDHLFEQVMVIGEGRPFLTALVVLNSTHLAQACQCSLSGCDSGRGLESAV